MTGKKDATKLLMSILCDNLQDKEVDSNLLLLAKEIALKNKVFLVFYEKCTDLHITIPSSFHETAQELSLKLISQKAILKELTIVCEKNGIEFMVVKTIKPFNYLGDDIDILVQDREKREYLTKCLQNYGFFIRQDGTPEITLRKFVGELPVDLDIHDDLGAGTIQYISKEFVWENKTKKSIDGLELFVPTIESELLITIGHSVLKEFRMSISDFYHYYLVRKQISRNSLEISASRNGLLNSLRIFDFLVNTHFVSFFNKTSNNQEIFDLSRVISSFISKSNHLMPYAYPIQTVAYAHFGKFKQQIKQNGLHAIWDYVRLPSSNGISLLFDYLEWIILKAEAIPWK